MSRKRFTAEKIITILREAELLSGQGRSIKEISRELGITEQTYYRWRKDYGGLRMDQAKRLKDLEKENILCSSSPGNPWENGYVESFNGKFRDGLLNGEIFDTLLKAKILIEKWRREYNEIRPHSSLDYRPPAPLTYEKVSEKLTLIVVQ